MNMTLFAILMSVIVCVIFHDIGYCLIKHTEKNDTMISTIRVISIVIGFCVSTVILACVKTEFYRHCEYTELINSYELINVNENPYVTINGNGLTVYYEDNNKYVTVDINNETIHKDDGASRYEIWLCKWGFLKHKGSRIYINTYPNAPN